MNLSKLKSDEELVAKIIKEHDLQKVNALFASHSHYDHVIDAPIAAKLTGATFYVDSNSQKVAKAYKEPKIKTELFQDQKFIQIGKFKITPILRNHSHIRSLGLNYLPGPVPDTFDFNFYDYHVGDTWFYLAEHPDGKILIDQGSEPFLDKLKNLTTDVQVVIQGIANRESDEVILKGYVGSFKPSIFIPTHFDNFVFPLNTNADVWPLPGVKLEGLMKKMKKSYPNKKVIYPKYAKKIELFK